VDFGELRISVDDAEHGSKFFIGFDSALFEKYRADRSFLVQ